MAIWASWEILIIFVSTIHCVRALSFNLSSIGPQNFTSFINGTEDADITNQRIQLTPDEPNKVGRASFAHPIHLWDKSTRDLSDFSTHFSFVIDSKNSSCPADGFTFFMAPWGSWIPLNHSINHLGLPYSKSSNLSSEHQFVSVEFDTGSDVSDNPGQQVGIHVSSITPLATVTWPNNLSQGMENQAWIRYNSTSKKLTVAFTGFANGSRTLTSLACSMDMRVYLPEWITIGFSAASGSCSGKSIVSAWTFNSSFLQNTSQSEQLALNFSSNPMTVVHRTEKSTVVGPFLRASAVAIIFMFLCGLWRVKKRNSEDEEEMMKRFGFCKFSYDKLVLATNDFAEKVEHTGTGTLANAYRGYLREQMRVVVVKVLEGVPRRRMKQVESELSILGHVKHRNLLGFIGWCYKKGKLLLVYELMQQGSLDSHLFQVNSCLIWDTRYGIVKGLASILLYLVEGCSPPLVHGDITSRNIMLDPCLNPKLGAFNIQLHRVPDETYRLKAESVLILPQIQEALDLDHEVRKDCDVYKFGIFLLEIACGVSFDIEFGGDTAFLGCLRNLFREGKLLEAADSKLHGAFDAKQMERVLSVGLWCAHPDKNHRPNIKDAVACLFNIQVKLPTFSPLFLDTILESSDSSQLLECTSLSSDSSCSGSDSSGTCPYVGSMRDR